MDYLESCINKFKMPRRKPKLLSSILIGNESEVDGEYSQVHEKIIIDVVQSIRQNMANIWENSDLNNRKKREIADEFRKRQIEKLQLLDISDKTIYYVLRKLETEYKNNARNIFFFLMDKSNYKCSNCVANVLKDSSEPIYKLTECDDGDVYIFGYSFRRELSYMPYDNHDNFREYVKDFLDEFQLSITWLAKVAMIDQSNLSKFMLSKRNLSKAKMIEIYRKTLEYRDRMDGFNNMT